MLHRAIELVLMVICSITTEYKNNKKEMEK